MTTNKLNVYLNKVFVGTFEQSLQGGALSFVYDSNYLKSKNPLALSISLALRSEPFKTNNIKPFFAGLLPEGDQLDLVADAFKVSTKNPFSLLREIGRDCAGSVEIIPHGEKVLTYSQGKIEKLTQDRLLEILRKTNNTAQAIKSGKNRFSLAGAQRKIAVFFDESKNSLPALVNGKPSTHILKPLMPRYKTSVHNEFFCMKLAKEMNLEVAEVFFKQLDEQPYLLIRRYDRTKLGKNFIRLHQEDFCQALGLMPEQKYQGVDGGPGIDICKDLISKHSARAVLDRYRFLRATIFNYLIGNSDAHGKNFSFLHKAGKTRLAPFYDLISTCCYAEIDHQIAMKIGKVKDPNRLSLNNWHQIVANTNTARSHLEKELQSFALTLPQAAKSLQEKLRRKGIESEIFDEIQNLIHKRSQKILGYFKS